MVWIAVFFRTETFVCNAEQIVTYKDILLGKENISFLRRLQEVCSEKEGGRLAVHCSGGEGGCAV